MKIGVPKETKSSENRISLTPDGAKTLIRDGHHVYVERGGGIKAGFSDEAYAAAGAELTDRAEVIYCNADMIIKVKEPQPDELPLIQPAQILFTYLHLAAAPTLTKALLEKEVVGIAYETVRTPKGTLPLLRPMSEIAGRMSVQIGARFLESHAGGQGMMLGGVPGVLPAEVVIVGGGAVGINAAKIAAGMGARVTVLDLDAERLAYLDDVFGGRVQTLVSTPYALETMVSQADLLIGAVLIPGAKAPRIVTKAMVQQMKPGSVIIDVAIDQGGSVETMDRVTTHMDPVFEKYGVLHYSVPNIPGAVPMTSTLALSNVTLPFVRKIATQGWQRALGEDASLKNGLNVAHGHITHRAVAQSLDLPYRDPNSLN